MSHSDVDMDLLRILEELRTAFACPDSDGEAPDLGVLLRRATDRCSDGPVGKLFEAAKFIVADGARLDETVREGVIEALTLSEEVLFASDDEELQARLNGLVRSLGAPGAEPSPTLDDAAALLIRMDPTDTGDFASLHGVLGSLVGSFRSLPDIRDQLNRAAEALNEVTGPTPSEGVSPESAIDEVGEILEQVMRLAEDAENASCSETELNVEAGPSESEVAIEAEVTDSEAPQSQSSAGVLPLGADEELVKDFIAEGSDYLDQAEVALLELERNPKDEESINVVFRSFHTIKGVAGFLGLADVAELSHHAESLLSRVREGEMSFTESVADLTLKTADVLRNLIDIVSKNLAGEEAELPSGYSVVLEILKSKDLDQRLRDGMIAELADIEDDAPSGGEPAASGPGSSDSSVRVKTERLDGLVDLVGELVVAHSMIAEDSTVLADQGELNRKVSRAEKILRELQDLSTSMRMVPLRQAFQKLNRVARDVSKKIEKPVRFLTEGEDTELDRNMVDVITDPLVHMVRNSIDHGLESPEERRAAGKDPEGLVTLAAYQAGGTVIIEISDDGRGLDRDRILAKAKERGLVESERVLSDQEVYEMIFAPGFSTAAEVTSVSGRGVGLDVVRKSVEALRGRIEIQSEPGKGSRFAIHLPLTLAITDGLLIGAGSERYILPMVKVHSSFQPKKDDLYTVAGRGEMVQLHDQLLPVLRLHGMYGIGDAKTDPTEALLVIVGEGSRRSALLVDDILGQQRFVVKALSGRVAETVGIAGGAIMADGAVGLILDPEELIEFARDPGRRPAA